jgi:hypothetical protein
MAPPEPEVFDVVIFRASGFTDKYVIRGAGARRRCNRCPGGVSSMPAADLMAARRSGTEG